MASKSASSVIKKIVFGILAFILSAILFLLTICVVLEASVFNKGTMLDNMHASNYFVDKSEEIIKSLTDLGYASGLDETFFAELTDTVMLTSDTEAYLTCYFDGTEDLVDDTAFKQSLNEALDKYIAEKNIQNVNAKNRDYLVKQAAAIYRRSLDIPLLYRFSAYFQVIKNYLPWVIVGLSAVALVLIAVIIFANKWKHRAAKYCGLATSGAFLALLVIPIYLTINRGASHINLESRALYNFVVYTVNNMNIAFWICTGAFLVISIGLFFLYRRLYLRATGEED